MKRLFYVAGTLLLCGAMSYAQDATTTKKNDGNVTGAPSGTTVTETKRDTIVMPKNKQVTTKKNTVKGGSKKVAAAPADLGRGGKAIGHNVKGGHPVAAGEAGVEGGKNFGKKVGSGTKSAAVGVKDKVGDGLSAVGHKLGGDKDKAADKTEAAADNTADATSNAGHKAAHSTKKAAKKTANATENTADKAADKVDNNNPK